MVIATCFSVQWRVLCPTNLTLPWQPTCDNHLFKISVLAAQVLRSKSDKINVENSALLIQNIDLHIQITIHTHYDKSSSSSRSDSPGFLEK